MISGRTRTAEQRAAGAETREDTGMGTVAAAGTERRAVAEMEEVAAVKIVAAEETEEAAVAEIAEAAGDNPHKGFEAFVDILDKYSPKYFIHGHVHMNYSREFQREEQYNNTTIINGYDRYIFEY